MALACGLASPCGGRHHRPNREEPVETLRWVHAAGLAGSEWCRSRSTATVKEGGLPGGACPPTTVSWSVSEPGHLPPPLSLARLTRQWCPAAVPRLDPSWTIAADHSKRIEQSRMPPDAKTLVWPKGPPRIRVTLSTACTAQGERAKWASQPLPQARGAG